MPVSLCVLRVEIDEDLPEMGDNPAEVEAAKEQKKKDRGERESKTITVETYASVLSGGVDTGLLPTSSRRSPEEGADDDDVIVFFCGNPLVEVTKGVLHLYKENELKEDPEAKMLCLLSVPGALGARDLLAFAAACQEDIAHVRILRDGSPDHYMALLTFRTTQAAREFHAAFDGVPYTSLEPGALCRIAWVSGAEWARDAAPPPGHTELPTCPVCLERMDESVAGVLSVQCAHTFHAACLLRWSSARCPVCRCGGTPEPRAALRCAACAAHEEDGEGEETRENISGVAEGLLDEVESGALWICLICGHVGCGRYEGGHAAKHFLQSNHTYALQLGSNRVWDYAGDNFVHRLMQNKADGKLVAAEAGADKLATAQLEFTYTLTAQLDTQRDYYDRQIEALKSTHKAECDAQCARAAAAEARAAAAEARAGALQAQLDAQCARAAAAEARAGALQAQLDSRAKENKTLEKKLHVVTNKLSGLQSELSEERGLGRALAASQAEWQASARRREDAFTKEVAELKEQLRDVMFFVEARGQLERTECATQDEIAAASVAVAPPARARRRRR